MVDQAARIILWERTPGVLAGALSGALVIAVSGSLLVHQADWNAVEVGAGLAGYAVLAVAVTFAAAWHLRDRAFGLANQITLLRTGLVCLVGGALVGGVRPSWSLAAVIALALTLDAVDGWLARRLGLASSFGARFDLEIDALMILTMSALVWWSGQAGAWVFLIGLMRYGFVALGWLWPAARRPLPPSFRRKAVCAVIGALLLLCLLPTTPFVLAQGLAAFALSAQLASFGIDLIWLRRRAGRGMEPA